MILFREDQRQVQRRGSIGAGLHRLSEDKNGIMAFWRVKRACVKIQGYEIIFKKIDLSMKFFGC